MGFSAKSKHNEINLLNCQKLAPPTGGIAPTANKSGGASHRPPALEWGAGNQTPLLAKALPGRSMAHRYIVKKHGSGNAGKIAEKETGAAKRNEGLLATISNHYDLGSFLEGGTSGSWDFQNIRPF